MHFVHIEKTPLGDFYKCHATASEMPNCRFFVIRPDAEPDTMVCEWFGIDITEPGGQCQYLSRNPCSSGSIGGTA
jgi:hypothetical protein